jgi:hypothetical protein
MRSHRKGSNPSPPNGLKLIRRKANYRLGEGSGTRLRRDIVSVSSLAHVSGRLSAQAWIIGWNTRMNNGESDRCNELKMPGYVTAACKPGRNLGRTTLER